MRQQTLFRREKLEFGGSLLTNKRKSKRPISTKSAIHLILKADSAESDYLFKHGKFINEQLTKWSAQFHITIFDKAIGGQGYLYSVEPNWSKKRAYHLCELKKWHRKF